MSKLDYYEVQHYRIRDDGRIEPAGTESRVMTEQEAMELSYSAIVTCRTTGFNGEPIRLLNGRHCQFDSHLGWVS